LNLPQLTHSPSRLYATNDADSTPAISQRYAEKRKCDATSSLVDALRTSQNDLDRAVARLGDVESEVVEGAARIEALERRVEGMRDRIEGERTRAEEDVSARLALFRKFEETFWSKERQLQSQLGYWALAE
jgi:hypothetical protein